MTEERIKEPKRSEADVKRAVMDLLKARGIMSFRMNAGDRFGSYKGRTWKIAGHPTGTADILAFLPLGVDYVGCHNQFILWIETKSSIGKQSSEQIVFERMVKDQGHDYILARSAFDVQDWLDKNT